MVLGRTLGCSLELSCFAEVLKFVHLCFSPLGGCCKHETTLAGYSDLGVGFRRIVVAFPSFAVYPVHSFFIAAPLELLVKIAASS